MKVTIHIIFDVELYPGFTYKAGIVAYGNKVDTPPYMTYASSESRYIVIILLLLADFNVLDVQCTNVQNSFLNADPKDILYLQAGEKFGKYWAKLVIVVLYLYEINSDGSVWAAEILQVMIDLVLQPCMSDADVLV